MATERLRGAEKGLSLGASPLENSPKKSLSLVRPNMAEHLVLMCNSALFAGIQEKDCGEIASFARPRTFARDELLFAQGQPVRSLILLQSGSVKHTQLSPNGNEVLLWMSGTGDAVNLEPESACGHTCSARALERCRTLVWEYNRLQGLLTQYPQIRKNISLILAGRLHELEERFREMATEKVAKRLALTLLRLLKRVGKPGQAGIEIALTREELAQMTGTTLFTISRVLSSWAETGVVQPRRQGVVINDPCKLEAIGEGKEV
ncbi:Crp/Fnr family transcriptional regulator [Acidobacteria bacterium AB60]|nr:Crp/Fnr family transcriptional regulator [Acidobacteria bacterium AB60]